MTGPLAQQIAQVRHVIAYLAEQSQHAEIDGTLPQDEAFAALSVIERHVQNAHHLIEVEWPAQLDALEVRAVEAERHVQDMEKALHALRDGHPGIPDVVRLHRLAVAALDDVLAAALPAREKGTE